MEIEKVKGTAKASATWARLIHKIFDVDPLLCPNCGKEMRIIAFITNYQEVKKILKHIGEETQRPPPLASISPSDDPNDYYEDYMPPDEVYFADEQWVS